MYTTVQKATRVLCYHNNCIQVDFACKVTPLPQERILDSIRKQPNRIYLVAPVELVKRTQRPFAVQSAVYPEKANLTLAYMLLI